MIFNSQICTTREQSERLIALGLKEDTADMKYPCTREYYGGVLTEGTSSLPIIIDTEDDDVTEYDIPAWSLHRLIEIVAQTQYPYYVISKALPIYDALCERIEWLIREGYFSKEYLK